MPPAIELFVFLGLTASGKSTLAQAFAAARGLACYNSDRLRKELAGVEVTRSCPEELNQGLYSPAFTRRTYAEMRARAEEELAAQRSVVLDGSYQSEPERELLQELARRHGAQIRFIRCFCSRAETKRRLALRAQDPAAVSDGRWEIYERQLAQAFEPAGWEANQLLALDTSAPVEELLITLDIELRRCRHV